MAIVYPLSLPTNYGMSNIVLSAENVGAISQSPFTFNQQIIRHAGERWLATVTLPPMKRVDSEPWIAMLMSLKGTYGTFLLGDPNAVQPQGSVVRRNIFNYSEDFSDVYWTKTNASVASTAETNPVSGLNTGVFNLIEDATLNQHRVFKNITYTAGLTYFLTLYLKQGSASRNCLVNFSLAAFSVNQTFNVDLTTGAIVVTSGTPVVTVESVGGFFKVVAKVVATITALASTAAFMTQGFGTSNYTGDGTSFIKIANFQVEQASSATAYQKTMGNFGPTPLVNGGSQVGETLNVKNLNESVVGVLKAGDYIQLSSGSGARLHKVLADVTSDAAGLAAIDIWPSLRSSPASNDVITVVNTVGRFRLSENIQSYEINNISSYGITFDCIEAL